MSMRRLLMAASAEEYAAFEERVRRTVYMDNLSPQVTENVLKAALDQFVNVVNVQFIPNYINPQSLPRAALVEMETLNQASAIIAEMADSPFMVLGMPRPVRARTAEVEMFDSRPKKPGRKITYKWLDPEDPDFEVARKIKVLTRKHASETEFLLNHQLKEEENLANQQLETLKAHYKKYELIDAVLSDNTAKKLADRYRIPLSDA
ncbi:ASI1-immunoprecipitated protein 1-like isoform X2 [Coffea arabica]|uniref:ASI1-immunoprecipitated protein 1-like isoform X2 n=2 Tax=Coffea arabica TaxID=13443 RepID=A0ABM4V8P6_COFAR